jgi:hypothetical protein
METSKDKQQQFISEEEYFRDSSVSNMINKRSDEGIDLKQLLINDDNNRITIPFSCKVYYSKSDFEILGVLGKGAYGKVVKARHIKDNKIKAIKIIDSNHIERVFIIINLFRKENYMKYI